MLKDSRQLGICGEYFHYTIDFSDDSDENMQKPIFTLLLTVLYIGYGIFQVKMKDMGSSYSIAQEH